MATVARLGLESVAIQRGAVFSRCRHYRYRLSRTWDETGPRVLFVMLNPSTADARRDDPTVRRCIGFARRWGFGGLEAVNLFAHRTPSPRELFAARDPVGPGNDRHIRAAAAECGRIVLAWGNHGGSASVNGNWVVRASRPFFPSDVLRGSPNRRVPALTRAEAVLDLLLPFAPLYCLGLTGRGQPRHPLYVPRQASILRFRASPSAPPCKAGN